MSSNLTKEQRAKAMAKTDGACFYCGEPATSIDHFFPKSKFPAMDRDPDNLLPSCAACNVLKSNGAAVDRLAHLRPFHGERMGLHLPVGKVGMTRGKWSGQAPYRKNKHKSYVGIPFER